MGEQQRYHAYLVRLWTVQRNGEWVWRASAVNAHTGDRYAFGNLGELFTFLVTFTESHGASSPTDVIDAPNPRFVPPVSGT